MRKFDRGSASHELLIGGEDRIRIIEADSYRTQDAREERVVATLAGQTPLLRHQYEDAIPMADAARAFIAESSVALRLAGQGRDARSHDRVAGNGQGVGPVQAGLDACYR